MSRNIEVPIFSKYIIPQKKNGDFIVCPRDFNWPYRLNISSGVAIRMLE